MAYTCSSCRLVFDERHAACPRCGGNPIIKSSSEFGGLDLLNKLREGYADARSGDTAAETQPVFGSYFQEPSSTTLPAEPARDCEPFFQPVSASEPVNESYDIPDPLPMEPINPPRNGTFNLANSWFGFLNFLFIIPWRLVFRLAMIAAVVGGALFLWNIRFLIVGAIIDFLISLIPIFLIIGAISYLVRLIFR